jgi:hypothetical protein
LGYKVEDKLLVHLGVHEQKRLNTTGLGSSDEQQILSDIRVQLL